MSNPIPGSRLQAPGSRLQAPVPAASMIKIMIMCNDKRYEALENAENRSVVRHLESVRENPLILIPVPHQI
jgi:hypothetical protein